MSQSEATKNTETDISDKSTKKDNRTRDRKRSRSRSKSRHSKKDSKRRKESSDSRRRHYRRSRSRSKDRRSRRHRSRDRTKHRRRSSSSSSSSNDSDKNEPTEKVAVKEDNKVADKPEDNLKKDQGKRSDDKGHRRSRDRRSKRSRSPDRRRRRRSKSRDRRRSKSRDRRRSKSRDRKPSRRSSREKDTAKPKDTDAASQKPSKDAPADEFGQEKLEEEMKKRRDRVEMWRMEQKLALRKAGQEEKDGGGESNASGKAWTLDDDDDDENNENSQEKDEAKELDGESKVDDKEDEDEIDPLDAFMQNLETENKKKVLEKNDIKTESNGGPKISRVVAVARKSKVEPGNTPNKHKGELMEANADAMEYSSEEEEESLDTAFNKFQNKQKNKKLDTVVDHSTIKYEDFNKKFYVEVPEIAAMTEEEVAEYRAELENVKVRGKNCPKPIKSWAQAGVSFKVLNALKKAKFEKPTSIQAQALPAIMSGHDLIGIAKTGSGKTLAFLLPMFRHIMDQRPLDDVEGPIAVIMTPTRELALQITKECKKFTKSLRLRVVCVYGGTGISEQIAELKRGAEIIICTPGRMIDMLAANNGRVTNMRRCTYMVLDEADRMFDMGFEPQVMSIINSCRPDRQTVVFSATFPRHMEALARRILNKPVEVQVGGRSIVCSDVTQNVVILAREQKFLKLLELLGTYQEQGSVLVFVDKQEHADSLLKDLMGSSYPCMALHGGIDQYDRDSVINDFKSGASRLLVATSVAARGLDVRNLILVVNYDCPNHYEDYVHRCGRTGRAGNKGFAYTFLTADQARYAGDIIRALELSGASVPTELENLWTAYKMELKSQGKEVSKNKGFLGRGFKFDETEDEMVRERKQFQKAALGLHDSDDDSPSKDIDEQIENMFNSKKRVKDVTGPMLVPGVGGAQASANANTNIQKLEKARRLASQINLKKNLGAEAQDITQQTASAVMIGVPFQAPKVSAKTIAEQLAGKLNQKLNYVPQEKPEEEDPSAGMKRYEEELEINDFPQTCRWKVTSKETLLQISEYSEAGITIRGQYYASGKQPEEDERKLYLAIEATSEIAVQKAKSEITRLIKEELIRLQNSYQPMSKNRYKIS